MNSERLLLLLLYLQRRVIDVILIKIIFQQTRYCNLNPDHLSSLLSSWSWSHLPNYKSHHFQATRCSFSGKVASDPESTVYISGCPEKESMDISLMSRKVINSPYSLSTSPLIIVTLGLDLILVKYLLHPHNLYFYRAICTSTLTECQWTIQAKEFFSF